MFKIKVWLTNGELFEDKVNDAYADDGKLVLIVDGKVRACFAPGAWSWYLILD